MLPAVAKRLSDAATLLFRLRCFFLRCQVTFGTGETLIKHWTQTWAAPTKETLHSEIQMCCCATSRTDVLLCYFACEDFFQEHFGRTAWTQLEAWTGRRHRQHLGNTDQTLDANMGRTSKNNFEFINTDVLRCDFACEDFFRGNISGELHGHSWTHGLEADIGAPGKHRSNTGHKHRQHCQHKLWRKYRFAAVLLRVRGFFFAENIWEELYGHSWTRT